jgi:hypothetical protein
MKLRACLFLLLAAALHASAVAAQRIDSPYRFIDTSQSLGPFVGYVRTDPGSQDLGPRSAAAFGIRYDIRLNGPLAVEAQVAYLPTTRTVHDTVFAGTTRRKLGTSNMGILLGELDFRFSLTGTRTWHGLAPFLVFGGGVALDTHKSSAVDLTVPADARYRFGTTFAGVLGAGTELYLTPRIGIRGDARAALWKLNTPSAFLVRNPLVSATQWTQNVLFSGQVAYHF